MGIESINKELYIIYSERVTPLFMTLLGLISFFLCYPDIGPTDYASITVAIAGLYMAIESSDEFINELCEYKLEQHKGEYTKTSSLLQMLSLSFTAIVFIFFITILVDESQDPTVVIEVVIMMIVGLFRIVETGMEIYYMSDAAEYVRLMYEIQDAHLISVIRDAYRLYLACDDKRSAPSDEGKRSALKEIEALSELPPIVQSNLKYTKRVRMIKAILDGEMQSDEFNGTDASIWDEFNIKIEIPNIKMPKALLDCLEQVCPFSDNEAIKVKQSHVWCFIPGNNSINISEEGLTSKVLGEYCKNFIPGIGVIWRYPPYNESIEANSFNGRDRWILMYKGAHGIVGETFDKTWEESIAVLNEYNNRISAGDEKGRTTELNELNSDGKVYDTMTLLEVIACTYTHFVQTGKKMYQERFTRVKEQTNSDQYGIHHLYIGRFNMSGLNNDAYLDVGGDECRFHLRGLSVCKRFLC